MHFCFTWIIRVDGDVIPKEKEHGRKNKFGELGSEEGGLYWRMFEMSSSLLDLGQRSGKKIWTNARDLEDLT